MRRVNLASPAFKYDSGDPQGFRSGMARVGPDLGASQLGATVYELPRVRRSARITTSMRRRSGCWSSKDARPSAIPRAPSNSSRGTRSAFPTGPRARTALRNETDETVRVLMFSNVEYPAVTVYPDSDKIGVWTRDKRDNLMTTRSSAVDYWHGETVPAEGAVLLRSRRSTGTSPSPTTRSSG